MWPGRVHHVERQALDRHLVAVGNPHRHHVGLGLVAHHGHAMGAVAQLAEAGDVVGVQMGVHGLDQLEIELAQELAVAVDLLQHGIEDQRLAAGAARQEIAVGARNTVEELAEDHGKTRRELPRDSITFRAYKRSNSLCKQENLEDFYSCDGRVGVT
ncbi:hypothetical protein ACVWZV_001291 [Bradyrhizobium sp. GM5.1]